MELNQTPGLVCSHHHLYSSLARGMPAPPRTPRGFREILELIWWRLDVALDLEMIEWAAKLGALEALERGCTAIVDHHESPMAIDGSLTTIANACGEVGVRVSCAYGVTDRHGPEGAHAGLAENERYLSSGGRGMVGLHAAFTCEDETIAAAAELARSRGVGVHVHVAEGDDDSWERLAEYSRDDWLLVHGVHLPSNHGLEGTLVHNPRSNMNNSVGYGCPTRFEGPVTLGSDGIGADMVAEFQLAYARAREHDVETSPEMAWQWLANGWEVFPEARNDLVTWNYAPMDPWHLAFTPGVTPREIRIDGEIALLDGVATRVDPIEVRAKAAEAAERLFKRIEED